MASSSASSSLKGDLLCKNGCGFFGNPEWQWFCSKCWREHQIKRGKKSLVRATPPDVGAGASPARRPGSGRRSPQKFLPSSSASSSSSSDRDKSSRGGTTTTLDRTNLKQLFRKANVTKAVSDKKSSSSSSKSSSKRGPSSSTSSSSSVADSFPPESKAVSAEFASYLNKRLDRPSVTDVSRQIKVLIDKILQEVETHDIDQVSAVVQEFYQLFRRRLQTHQHFQALTDQEHQSILDFAEKYTMICLYKHLFCPPTTNDEEKDLELQNRIRRLNWLTTKDLNCAIDEASQEVRDYMHAAINEILEMDGQMAPQDKLSCLVRCCKSVFEMLRVSNESPASADEFLPCLILICLKANPPRVQSNINFITRFCNEDKLRMGEAGYFFANLCCALSFIENMTAQSLNMDTDEFDSYVSGESVPPGSWQSSLLMCDSLQTMTQNLKVLADLKTRHDEVLAGTLKLQQEMADFQAEIGREVEQLLANTQYEIKQGPRRRPVDVDDDSQPMPELLPSPLRPEAAGTGAAGGVTTTESLVDVNPPTTTSQSAPAAGADVGPVPPAAPVAAASPPRDKELVELEDYLKTSQPSMDNISLLDLSIGQGASPSPSLLEESMPVLSVPSVTSLTTTAAAESSAPHSSPKRSCYRGFSAQSSRIPSISCDNSIVESPQAAAADSETPPSAAAAADVAATATASSALPVKGPESSSPDEKKKDAVTAQAVAASIQGEDSLPAPAKRIDDSSVAKAGEEESKTTSKVDDTVAKVLSGVFDTFDKLI